MTINDWYANQMGAAQAMQQQAAQQNVQAQQLYLRPPATEAEKALIESVLGANLRDDKDLAKLRGARMRVIEERIPADVLAEYWRLRAAEWRAGWEHQEFGRRIPEELRNPHAIEFEKRYDAERAKWEAERIPAREP